MKVEPFDTQRQLTFSRRTTVLTGGVLLLFGGVGARLYDLQVRRHDEFQAKADDNRFRDRIVVPLRGEILDRYGHVIASNRQNFRALIVPEKAGSVAEAIARFEQIIPMTDEQRDRFLRELSQNKDAPFTPVQVIDNLTWDQFSKINFNRPRLPGIVADVGDTRYYPDGEIVAPIVGHVGAANNTDMRNTEDDSERLLYRQPGFRLGKLGLEMTYDEELRGHAGRRTDEVDAAGRVIEARKAKENPARQGKTLAVTIDTELQREAHRILATDYQEYPEGTEGPGEVSASAVVMDTVTGDILVMASTPSFDPNDFARRVDAQVLRELETSPLKPMLCKPSRGTYPPGSTFKLLTAVAAQEAGVDPNTRFYCNGGMNYGGRRFSCWKREGHGSMNMSDAIKHSCDVYFWQLAQRIDIDDLANVARRFGLGQSYDIGLARAAEGTVPDRAWKRNYYRTNPEEQTWYPGETLSVAIGQGSLTSTPLQLAVMTARLATGNNVKPRLVRSVGDDLDTQDAVGQLVMDVSHLEVVRDGMDAVVNRWGTAARSTLMPEFQMAGKTGTSQIGSLKINPATGEPYPNHELHWTLRDHALFVAFAPYDNPRYACSVVVEHGGSGSKSAGPRARDMMRAVLRKDPANTEKHPVWRPGDPIEPVRLASTRVVSGGGQR